ncbi:MAG: protein kinase [Microcystis sp. LE19-131.1A]|uniref:protein kinase domain-containing protein n=1 Tax=Microcystis sp. LE19-131.1A TaxID=3016439 RepID=UPI0022C37280|nr:protein kinase [Microcystis sp. LE19-131.1A]MCZ8244396.1 protein kinase [Microcystis sp. LE19-131.1A]
MVWQAGQLLHNGKYEILEVLGRGGFGLTYKARHRQLTLEVVIKTPHILQKRDTEYEDYVRQFEAEGRKLAKFSQTPHAHIVRISDFFTEGQVPCLVMDFIQGQTLMERVKTQGKLSEAECLKYIRQIGSALEAVHQAGMVHRDAHPGNIMIQPNGNAILIDFGIAKEIIPAGSSSTDYAANPSFAPYEQIYGGSKANRQPSVDIYALAASFYYAVTGQKPTPSMERRLENRPLTSPKEINRNLSDHLNKAITLGMALEKENRPQSMSDWLQQLESPPPPVEEKYRQEKVNPPQPRKEPKVAETKAPVNPKPSDNSLQKKLKALPWGRLIGVFLVYGVIGFFLFVAASPPRRIIAVAVAMAVLMPGAATSHLVFSAYFFVLFPFFLGWMTIIVWNSWSLGIFIGTAFGVILFLAVAHHEKHPWLNSVASLIFIISPGLVGGIASGILAKMNHIFAGILMGIVFQGLLILNIVFKEECKGNKISPFNIFLILAVTNLSGLASGWLLGFLLHSKG